MININNKLWSKLRLYDIEKFLKTIEDDETFFLEFKTEDIRNSQLTKELSAFANSYGGYLFLGVDDSKKVVGCTNVWSELRINNVICNGISPMIQFDIKKFNVSKSKKLFVIKVEEGVNPPYITSDGYLYHRVSSSSDRIKDSNTLNNLYLKSQNNIKNIENKIYIPELIGQIPENLCGYVDFGFSLVTKNIDKTRDKIENADIEGITKILEEYGQKFSVSRVGYSLLITIGSNIMRRGEQEILTTGGLSNFMEILSDGSFRCRVIITSNQESDIAGITPIILIHSLIAKIYEKVFGDNFSKLFIEAKKYEKLKVIKIFHPMIMLGSDDKYKDKFEKHFYSHVEKYGDNIIANDNRIPLNGFITIDKSLFDLNNIKFNNNNLYDHLFYTEYFLLGYIDNLTFDDN